MHSYKNYKNIGFDLDGTLYPGTESIDSLIQEYIYEKISSHLNISLTESKGKFIDLYKGERGLSGRQTLEELGIPNAGEVVQEALENADVAPVLSPDTKTLELLKKLRELGKDLSIITGSGKNQLDRKLEALSLPQSLFTHIITDEVSDKSSGAAYALWLSYYPDAKPEDFLYIGDRSKTDYETPQKLGISAILVNITETKDTISCPQLKNLDELSEYLL